MKTEEYEECPECNVKETCEKYTKITGKLFCPKHIKTIKQTKLF